MSGRACHGRKVSLAQFRDMLATMRQGDVARELGISQQAVHYRAKARGLLTGKMGPAPTIADDDEFASMWNAGLRTDEVARHFGVSERTVRNHVQRLNLPRRMGRITPKITMTEYRQVQIQVQIAKAMAASAAETARAMKAAQEVDRAISSGARDG